MSVFRAIDITDAEAAMLRRLIPALESFPGDGFRSKEDDRALWSFINKLRHVVGDEVIIPSRLHEEDNAVPLNAAVVDHDKPLPFISLPPEGAQPESGYVARRPMSPQAHAKLWRTAGKLYAENLAKRKAGKLPGDNYMFADIALLMGFCNVMADLYEKERGP